MSAASIAPAPRARRLVPAARVAVLGRLPAGVEAAVVRQVLARAILALGLGRASLCVRFAADRTLGRFNRRYRGVDRPTDVLSFAVDPGPGEERFLGDLLVSRDRAVMQARRSGSSVRREVEELVLHGLLHLLGHDHERDQGQMNALELELRSRLLDVPARRRRKR